MDMAVIPNAESPDSNIQVVEAGTQVEEVQKKAKDLAFSISAESPHAGIQVDGTSSQRGSPGPPPGGPGTTKTAEDHAPDEPKCSEDTPRRAPLKARQRKSTDTPKNQGIASSQSCHAAHPCRPRGPQKTKRRHRQPSLGGQQGRH